MKKIGSMLWALFLTIIFGTSAWAGVNYIQYHEEYKARQEGSVASQPEKENKVLRHESKYLRENEPGTGTMVPNPEKPKPGQKYDRPDWAK